MSDTWNTNEAWRYVAASRLEKMAEKDAEIERLNKQVEDDQKMGNSIIKEHQQRIKELKDDRNFWATAAEWERAEADREYKADYNERNRTGKCADGNHFNDKQIDAAWEMATKTFNGAYSVIGRWLLRLLECFGIKRCEICDRSPGKQHEWGKDELQPCANCNGHEWVIGDEDE